MLEQPYEQRRQDHDYLNPNHSHSPPPLDIVL